MFRLTRNLTRNLTSRCKTSNLRRFSSIRTDDDLTGNDRADDLDKQDLERSAERPDSRKPDFGERPNVERSNFEKKFVPESGGLRERDEFFGEIEKKLKTKQELVEFREDLNRLTLAECLEKYECSIADALQLDPSLQKRILIKVRVVESVQ